MYQIPHVYFNYYLFPESKLLIEFKKILPSPKQVNGGKSSPEYFLDAILDSSLPEIPRISKTSLVLEIGRSSSLFRKNRCNRINFTEQPDILGILKVLGT